MVGPARVVHLLTARRAARARGSGMLEPIVLLLGVAACALILLAFLGRGLLRARSGRSDWKPYLRCLVGAKRVQGVSRKNADARDEQ